MALALWWGVFSFLLDTLATSNFRERERLKRKKARWTARLAKMPALERSVLLAAIEEYRRLSSFPAIPDPLAISGV